MDRQEESKTGGKAAEPVAWRTLCRLRAAEQAAHEGRLVWGVAEDGPIPFNHRWEHVQEVVQLALWLARELDADAEVAEAAAWLHDVCKGEAEHGAAGAAAAAVILAKSDFPVAKIAAVADAIRQHAGLFRAQGAAPIEPLEAALLWDADKLSKLGVQALAFNLSTIYAVNKSLAQRRKDNRQFASSVLQRTVTSMNTQPARRMAERRYRDMVVMLETWAREEAEAAL